MKFMEQSESKEVKSQENIRGGKDAVNGIIKRVIFQNAETGFTILNIFSNGKFITASGTFFDAPLPDSKIKLKGEFAYHKKYGYQFNFTEYEVLLSNTKTAIIDYLSSNIFKGIGRVIAAEIYEKFQEKTLEIIDNEPEKLREVSGIGSVKLAVVLTGLKESYGLRKAVMFFKPYQFTDYQIKAIYNQFADKSVSIARQNPYLFTEIKGIGFKKADIMAEKLGIKRDDPNRIKEAIKYVISQVCESSGNSYIYYRNIKDGISEIIGEIAETDLKNYLNELISEKKILLDFKDLTEAENHASEGSSANASLNAGTAGASAFMDNPPQNLSLLWDDKQLNLIRVYLPVYYYCEAGIAKELKRIIGKSGEPVSGGNSHHIDASAEAEPAIPLKTTDSIKSVTSAEGLTEFLERNGSLITLTEEQKNAVLNALKYKISIISGGPGTGKSTIIKTIVNLFGNKKIALTSLSGKAAQRLSDIISQPQPSQSLSFQASDPHPSSKSSKFAKSVRQAGGDSVDISTIHRLLKAQYDRQTNESFFTYNENNKLPHDLIVIDEMSMVDLIIFYKLLKAVKNETTLVFVGDVNQIPAVSPGDVLRDLIYADINMSIPSAFLTKVFRQNEGGLINLNAHNLLNNRKFVTSINYAGKDAAGYKDETAAAKDNSFKIKYRKEYDEAVVGKTELLADFTRFVKMVSAKRLGIKTGVMQNSCPQDIPTKIFDDIQILTPMKRGDLGYFNLNTILQDIFNPSDKSASAAAADFSPNGATFICNGVSFRLYDRIIQKKNNYDLDVFNGDSGYIINIDHTEKSLTVDFSNSKYYGGGENSAGEPSKLVKYDFLDVSQNISLAYALSIHKAQGSEFNNVIVLFHQAHYMMLKKNLLYTAITRGKKNVVIFGTFKAFGIALRSKEEIRNSGLKDRLAEEFSFKGISFKGI